MKSKDWHLKAIYIGFVSLGIAYLASLIGFGATGMGLALAISSSIALFLFLSLCGLLLLYNAKKRDAEGRMRKEVMGQLDDLKKGTAKVSPRRYGFYELDSFQEDINSFIAAYLSSSPDSDAPLYKGKRYLCPKSEFEEAMLEEIRRNRNYRQAVLAIDILGPVNEQANEKAKETIFAAFPYALLSLREPRGYYAYIYDAGSESEFTSRCHRLLSDYAYQSQGGEEISSLRLGGAVFPLVPAISLIDRAEKSLQAEGDLSIDSGDGEAFLPSPRSNEASRRNINLANFEKLYRQTLLSDTRARREQSISKSLAYFLESEGFDIGGALEYSRLDDSYRVYCEQKAKGCACASFSSFGKSIPASWLDPVYECAKADFPLYIRYLKDAPKPVMALMQSLGAESALLAPIIWEGRKYGFLYLLSSHSKDLTLEGFDKAHNLYSILSSSLIVSRNVEEAGGMSNLLDQLAKRSDKYVYSIDEKTFQIKECTANLEKRLGGKAKGRLCHEAFFNSPTPCLNCPIHSGTNSCIIPSISPKESTVSLVSKSKSGLATLIIEASQKAPSGSSLVDKALIIPSPNGFRAMLSRELIEKEGFILAFRLLDSGQKLLDNPAESNSTILLQVLENLQITPYYADAYRLDDVTIAIRLSGLTTRSGLYKAVETIQSAISEPISLGGEPYTPHYAYCSISYPTEAGSGADMLSLLKTELSRSAEFGEGYLAEVGRNSLRKAGRSEYLMELLEASLEKDAASFGLTPIAETSTGKPRYYEAFLTLLDENRLISSSELNSLLKDEKMRRDLDFSVLRGLGALYRDYGKSLMKASGVHCFYYRMKASSFLDPSFGELLESLFATYHFHKGGLGLLFEAKDLFSRGGYAQEAIKKATEIGARIGVYGFDASSSGSDFPYDGLSLFIYSSGFIKDTMNSESTALLLLQSLNRIGVSGGMAVASGIIDETARYYAAEMGFKLGKGKLYGSSPISKERFIASLSYK